MTNPWTAYVKANYGKVKANLEAKNKDSSLGAVIAILAKGYTRVVRDSSCADPVFSSHCKAKGKVCHENEVRRSCRSNKVRSTVCDEEYRAYCQAKGKVCHKNAKRRSCRKSANKSKSKSKKN